MLKLLTAMLMLAPMIMMIHPTALFPAATAYSMTIAFMMTTWLAAPLNFSPHQVNTWLMLDKVSAPLVLLSAWLLPLMFIASQHHMTHEPLARKRAFLAVCALLQTTLILTFLANNLMLFFIAFESTLIPTLFLIARWGMHSARLAAGNHFLMYTLTGSLPLLVGVLHLGTHHTTLLLHLTHHHLPPTLPITMLWLSMIAAFLIKLPLYSLHLWLPMAHVEAPIAGSMALAAVLLKLGGYGIIRITPILSPTMQHMHLPPLIFALWGAIVTSIACLRLTDLKAIIAYSSVSHMGLVAAAALIQTPWSVTGAMLLMMGHGLTSSMLFCLANILYERVHTRNLLLIHGLRHSLPLMFTWWLAASLMNMAFPPSINFLGELTVISSLYSWSWVTILITTPTMVITALYTLHIVLSTQWLNPHGSLPTSQLHTREHLLLLLHLLPLILLTFAPDTLYN